VAQLREAGTTVLLVTHELDEAEALCDSVIAMRGGRVLDAGPPAALVARHAGWAAVTFSWPEADRAAVVSGLRGIAGVRDVTCAGGRVTAHGTRQSIAYVGADLVRRGRVPDDLTVEIPDLESALLGLLDGPRTAHPLDLTGASR
jgi:ABC-2 type transport system ATP-binding protein